MEVRDLLATVAAFVVTTLAFLLKNTIALVAYAYQNYPEYTSIVFAIIGVYLVYKFVVKIFKMWLNLLIATIKTFLVLATLAVAATIYLRGWGKFVNQDIPFLVDVAKSITSNEPDNQNSFWLVHGLLGNQKVYSFLKNGFQNAGESASSILEDAEFDIDPNAYFEYMNENFYKNKEDFNYENIKRALDEGFENLEDYLSSKGLDINDLGN
ncbi:hypothetical protein PICST_28808, partial [Scheffersomyces stipitis CBS 6054]